MSSSSEAESYFGFEARLPRFAGDPRARPAPRPAPRPRPRPRPPLPRPRPRPAGDFLVFLISKSESLSSLLLVTGG